MTNDFFLKIFRGKITKTFALAQALIGVPQRPQNFVPAG
jgi:hypothetical protein